MAEAAGIDLASIAPERSGTSITKADVEEAIQKRDEELVMSPSTKVTRLSPTRKTIARHLQESHATTVPVTYMSEVDVTRLLELRRRILKELPENSPRPTVTDLFIRLACLVLPRHPHMNAILVGDQLEVFTAVHMGLAVDTPRGLIVPVIRDAQDKGLLELARTRRELVERTVNEKLGPEELSGGTFTITNLGTMGVDFFTPVINSPQVAILGIGRIREIPVVRKRKVKIRQVIGLSITCDHRLIDGAPAARFLKDLADWVEEPDRIWL